MKSHILTLTIKSIKDEKESFTDHYEVFCDEEEKGISTYQQAKNRLNSLEMEYATDNNEAEIWASNISLIVETSEHYSIEQDNFPENKFSWLETYFEVVNFITLEISKETNNSSVIKTIQDKQGQNGLYQLAIKWTQEFEEKDSNEEWGDIFEYYERIELFLNEKIKI
jgi:hypothetical protein